MSSAVILGLVGGLLVVAFLANRVFGLTRIPDVLVLMTLGVLVGPGLGLVQAGTLAKTTNLLGTLAIILVLFEGGLELDLRDTIQHFPGSFLLARLGRQGCDFVDCGVLLLAPSLEQQRAIGSAEAE